MPTCELCWREATHVDSAVIDVFHSGVHGETAYRQQPLCPIHATERRESNMARVRCLHEHLDAEGQCYQCGADCRGVANV